MAGPRSSPDCAAQSLVAEAFGDVLEGARRRRDLGPDQVATRAGISIARLFMIEHAHMKPRLDLLFRVAGVLGVSRTWLIDEVIDWLAPYANLARGELVGAQITDHEAEFVHQLIHGAHAPIRSDSK